MYKNFKNKIKDYLICDLYHIDTTKDEELKSFISSLIDLLIEEYEKTFKCKYK